MECRACSPGESISSIDKAPYECASAIVAGSLRVRGVNSIFLKAAASDMDVRCLTPFSKDDVKDQPNDEYRHDTTS